MGIEGSRCVRATVPQSILWVLSPLCREPNVIPNDLNNPLCEFVLRHRTTAAILIGLSVSEFGLFLNGFQAPSNSWKTTFLCLSLLSAVALVVVRWPWKQYGGTFRLSLSASVGLVIGEWINQAVFYTSRRADPTLAMLNKTIWLGLVFVGYFALTYLAMNCAVFIRLRYRPVHPEGHCAECGYDLTGNVSGVCPECGGSITRLSQLRGFAREQDSQ